MGLQEAQRLLRWNVVMEALKAAGVDAETQEMVESARQAGDIAESMTRVLLGLADTQRTKNYVKVEMVGLSAPFERAYVELIREGGKTSHEILTVLRDRLNHLRDLLSTGPFQPSLCQGMVEGIDEDLALIGPYRTM